MRLLPGLLKMLTEWKKSFADHRTHQRSIGFALAFLVCLVLLLSEFGTFHLGMTDTLGTELAAIYNDTGSAEAVALAAWPVAVLAVLAAAFLWRKTRQWATQPALEQPEN